MALQASASIQINNFTDSLNCIISSSGGSTFVDQNNGTTLICRLFNADEGEVDAQNESNQYQYYYFWQRNGEDWRENKVEGKILNITNSDLSVNTDAIVFSCLVYDKTTYDVYITNETAYQESGSESDEEPQEPPMVAYGEINLDMTIKKWMTFDDQTGLWVRKKNSGWATLTDEKGFHIYNNRNGNNQENLSDLYDIENWIGSFAGDSLITQKIRLNYAYEANLDENHNKMSRITLSPTESYGWKWTSLTEGDEIDIDEFYDNYVEEVKTNIKTLEEIFGSDVTVTEDTSKPVDDIEDFD